MRAVIGKVRADTAGSKTLCMRGHSRDKKGSGLNGTYLSVSCLGKRVKQRRGGTGVKQTVTTWKRVNVCHWFCQCWVLLLKVWFLPVDSVGSPVDGKVLTDDRAEEPLLFGECRELENHVTKAALAEPVAPTSMPVVMGKKGLRLGCSVCGMQATCSVLSFIPCSSGGDS